MPSFNFEQIPDLQGRVAIVTGATSGIGEVTVRELAKKGCKVYLLGRNEEKAREVMKSLKGDIVFIKFDSSDLSSVKEAAQQFRKQENRLDILVNNAGIGFSSYSLSKDGIEIQQATNAIGPAILTFLLIDILVKTSRLTKGDHSVRIVQTSSAGHAVFGSGPPKQSWLSIEDVNREQGSPMERYGQSKVANILLAEKIKLLFGNENITNISLHPGSVKTKITSNDDPNLPFIGKLVGWQINWLGITPDQGALSTLYASTSPTLNDVEKYNGLYLDQKAKHSQSAKHARDPEFVEQFFNFIKMIAKEKIDVDIDQLIAKARQ